jgi:hypothetical protein
MGLLLDGFLEGVSSVGRHLFRAFLADPGLFLLLTGSRRAEAYQQVADCSPWAAGAGTNAHRLDKQGGNSTVNWEVPTPLTRPYSNQRLNSGARSRLTSTSSGRDGSSSSLSLPRKWLCILSMALSKASYLGGSHLPNSSLLRTFRRGSC